MPRRYRGELVPGTGWLPGFCCALPGGCCLFLTLCFALICVISVVDIFRHLL